MNNLFRRIGAYIFDILLLSVIVSAVTMIVPKSDKLNDLYERKNELIELYNDEEISIDEYSEMVVDIDYDISINSLYVPFITFVLSIAYFIVLQYFMKGRTLGKKLLRIRVVANDGKDLPIGSFAIRSLIVNSILVSILDMIFIFVLDKSIYLKVNNYMFTAQGFILIMIFVMICFGKSGRGIHDILSSSKVVMEE